MNGGVGDAAPDDVWCSVGDGGRAECVRRRAGAIAEGGEADAPVCIAGRGRSSLGSVSADHHVGTTAGDRVRARGRVERRQSHDQPGLRALLRAGWVRDGVDGLPADPSGRVPAERRGRKTTVRYLRKHAATYNLDPDRICLWGTSAGGHLAAIAALAPRGTFDGTEWPEQSSAVKCVLDAYGPTWFTTMDEETTAEAATLQPVAAALASAPPMVRGVVAGPVAPGGAGASSRGRCSRCPSRSCRPGSADASADPASSPESRLVGAAIQSVPDRVREASPITYVSAAAPPFLIMHGTADNWCRIDRACGYTMRWRRLAWTSFRRLIDGLPHTFFNRDEPRRPRRPIPHGGSDAPARRNGAHHHRARRRVPGRACVLHQAPALIRIE